GHDYEVPIAAASQNNGSSFELRELTGGLDLSRYQTGALGDNMGFMMAPGDTLKSSQARTGADSAARSHSSMGADGAHAGVEPGAPPRMSPGQERGESPVFTGTGNVHSDTVSRILLDELEGVDFYIAQGYVDIARDTLDRLRDEHGDHQEILIRYKRLGLSTHETPGISLESPIENADSSAGDEFPGMYSESPTDDESIFMGEVPRVSPAAGVGATTGELMPIMDQPELAAFSTTSGDDLMFPVAQ